MYRWCIKCDTINRSTLNMKCEKLLSLINIYNDLYRSISIMINISNQYLMNIYNGKIVSLSLFNRLYCAFSSLNVELTVSCWNYKDNGAVLARHWIFFAWNHLIRSQISELCFLSIFILLGECQACRKMLIPIFVSNVVITLLVRLWKSHYNKFKAFDFVARICNFF